MTSAAERLLAMRVRAHYLWALFGGGTRSS